jgi:hypothetical protein
MLAFRLFSLSIVLCYMLRGDSIVISVTGALDGGFYPLSSGQAAASSWSSSMTYDDITISALLTGGPSPGTAYLMTQTGPGTTTTNQIASENFVFPQNPETVTFFAGLTLDPGTYYLVVGSPVTGLNGPVGGWRDTSDSSCNCFPPPTIALDTGVTRNVDFLARGSVNAYTPASTFQQGVGIHGDPDLQYIVTGVVVPEPSSLLLFVSASLVPLVYSFRR